MSYDSVDALQRYLADEVFHRTRDPKKASGRALGTLVEIITFYLLKSWGMQSCISIETKLPEFGCEDITHNVEFTLHHHEIVKSIEIVVNKSITTHNIVQELELDNIYDFNEASNKKIIDIKKLTIKNGAILGEDKEYVYTVHVDTNKRIYTCYRLIKQAYAMFECKRVGKEGETKGPQTIEKAKQGAYVARSVSELQRIKTKSGDTQGLLIYDNSNPIIDEYYTLLMRIIQGDLKGKIKKFILTIGIVSNHGNWFTYSNQNKELKVLCQSYDWLLFLTDKGLTRFIHDIFQLKHCHTSFIHSYSVNETTGKKNANIFTKSVMSYYADMELNEYFSKNIKDIEEWFTVLSPYGENIQTLKTHLRLLGDSSYDRR